MNALSFDQLPQAVYDIQLQLSRIENLLAEKSSIHPVDVPDLMGVSETAKFLKVAPQTVYQKVSNREIPFSKKGKRLYFSRAELRHWIASGRKATRQEITESV